MTDTVVVTSADDAPAVLLPTMVDALAAAQAYASQCEDAADASMANATSAGNSANQAASSAAIAYARIEIADDNYIGLSTDISVIWTSLTAPRVYTLPPAASYKGGRPLTVADGSGSCSSINTITVLLSGTDTIAGVGTNPLIVAPGGCLQFLATSAGKWIMIS